MGSQPTHQDVAAAVSQLCYDSIAELEAGLKAQVDSDTAAREEKERAKDRAREEMKKAKDRARMAEEAARLVADLEAQEKPRFAQSDNSSAKRVWLDTQDIVDNDDDDDDEDHEEEEEEEEEEGNDSAPDDVRILCIH
jgi:hypothetical protein